jgi:hypothetical protein
VGCANPTGADTNGSVTSPEPAWRRSSRCGSSACVEVAPTDSGVLVRDSKNPHRAPLAFSHAEWRAFQDGVEGGDFSFE